MMNLNVFQGEVNQRTEVAGLLGGSSFGFRLGSSLALAAGRSWLSSSDTISNSSSSLPWKKTQRQRKNWFLRAALVHNDYTCTQCRKCVGSNIPQFVVSMPHMFVGYIVSVASTLSIRTTYVSAGHYVASSLSLFWITK